MTPDLTPDIVSIKDEARPERDGSISKARVVVFYLGKHGPFTERFALADFSDAAVKQKIAALQQMLANIHR